MEKLAILDSAVDKSENEVTFGMVINPAMIPPTRNENATNLILILLERAINNKTTPIIPESIPSPSYPFIEMVPNIDLMLAHGAMDPTINISDEMIRNVLLVFAATVALGTSTTDGSSLWQYGHIGVLVLISSAQYGHFFILYTLLGLWFW